MFKAGACIYPKPLWCIDIVKHPKLGIDPKYPYVRTSERAIKRAKSSYEGVVLRGNIEARFLYAVVSGSELVPFGFTGVYLAILPIEVMNGKIRIIERAEAEGRGFRGLADWLRRGRRFGVK